MHSMPAHGPGRRDDLPPWPEREMWPEPTLMPEQITEEGYG